MIPFVLPLVLVIADDCNVHEYNELVLPILIPAFKIYEPIQVNTSMHSRYYLFCTDTIDIFTKNGFIAQVDRSRAKEAIYIANDTGCNGSKQ